MELMKNGSALCESEVLRLEAEIEDNPEDVQTRAKLIGFYKIGKASPDLLKHYIWLIENRSSSQLTWLATAKFPRLSERNVGAYFEIRNTWLTCLKSNLSQIETVIAAVNFFEINKDIELAENVLLSALQISPENSRLLSTLSGFRENKIKFGQGYGPEALNYMEQAMKLEKNEFLRFAYAIKLPSLAFQANQFQIAKQYALALLDFAKKNESDIANYGYALHKAFTVLGKIEFQNGNLQLAYDYLKKSTDIPYSFTYFIAGPDLSLVEMLRDYPNFELISLIQEYERVGLDLVPLQKLKKLRERLQR